MKLLFDYSGAHLNERFRPTHGPQTWEWWRLFSFSIVELDYRDPLIRGKRLWIYSRWGAIHFDLSLDRR